MHIRMTEIKRIRPPSATNVLKSAELLLSQPMQENHIEVLFSIAPNPFEQGRKNQVEMWKSNWRNMSQDLIWC